MPGAQDLEVYEGDDVEIPFDLIDSTNDEPVDLSVYQQARCQVRAEPGSPVVLTPMATIDAEEPGRVWLSFPGTATVGKVGEYQWDLELSSPVRTVLAGAFIISPEITTG